MLWRTAEKDVIEFFQVEKAFVCTQTMIMSVRAIHTYGVLISLIHLCISSAVMILQSMMSGAVELMRWPELAWRSHFF